MDNIDLVLKFMMAQQKAEEKGVIADLRDIKAKTEYLELLKEGNAETQNKTIVDSIYPGEVH